MSWEWEKRASLALVWDLVDGGALCVCDGHVVNVTACSVRVPLT